jgi:hypothetical protein
VKFVPFCEHRVKLTNLPERIDPETLEKNVRPHIGPNGNIELIHIDNRIHTAILHLNSKEAKDLLLKKGSFVVVSTISSNISTRFRRILYSLLINLPFI